jgi:hypothetical protein
MWKSLKRWPVLVALVVVLGGLAVGWLAWTILVEDDTEPAGSCKLHHIPYAVEIIPVHYGLPFRPERRELTEAQQEWQEEEHAAWKAGFCYSHVANKAGGCVVRWARFAKVSYCPECRRADEEWHAKHGHSPPAAKAD